jgi:hypothetical protein
MSFRTSKDVTPVEIVLKNIGNELSDISKARKGRFFVASLYALQ